MAYRRKHGITRSATFKEDIRRPPREETTSNSAPTSPLASQGGRVSDTHRESPLSSGHNNSAFQSSLHNRSKGGGSIVKRSQDTKEAYKLQNKIIETNNDEFFLQNQWQDNRITQSAKPQTSQDQLNASRDVAIATAAKAKLLLREIKTVKADFAFAKERSCQLEEENKILREAREKGDHPADDDMIRLQLETLLAEKARLAHENSVYIRENSCLREIIKYHNLSMQDVVYLDEGIEEVAEVNPSLSRTLSVSPPLPSSPRRLSQTSIPEINDIPTLDKIPTNRGGS
uniref:uncharacterized protein LOC122591707 n=1 Tax=Erigeron canadensis TaxID=72917 RepID=UPI001CB96B09|nr:uncharacterized protein LOC122591707 [Erigeron canadensis]